MQAAKPSGANHLGSDPSVSNSENGLSGPNVIYPYRRSGVRTRWSRKASAIAWILSMVFILFTGSVLGLPSGTTAVSLAGLGLVHSAMGFCRHGGARITPAGVLLFAMLIFGYFPTLYYAWTESNFVPVAFEVRGLVALLIFQFVLYPFFSLSDHGVEVSGRTAVPPSVWIPAVVAGLLMVFGGLLINMLNVTAIWPLAQPAGYAGIVLIALSLLQARHRINVLVLGLVLSLFASFVILFFSGGGRNVLGSLALGLAMATGFVWRPSLLKPMILVALPPVLWLLARLRADSVANPFTGYQESGLESVVRPQRLFFQLIQDQQAGNIELGYGETFVASVLSWVPREFWIDKPVGLGTTLTQLYRPDLLAAGHSEAGLLHGELIYNFGFWGLIFGAVALGFWIFWLDKWVTSLHQRTHTSISTLFAQAVTVTLTAGIVDLVWVGTFTYVARAGFACALLGVLWITFKLLGLTDGRDWGRSSPANRANPVVLDNRGPYQTQPQKRDGSYGLNPR